MLRAWVPLPPIGAAAWSETAQERGGRKPARLEEQGATLGQRGIEGWLGRRLLRPRFSASSLGAITGRLRPRMNAGAGLDSSACEEDALSALHRQGGPEAPSKASARGTTPANGIPGRHCPATREKGRGGWWAGAPPDSRSKGLRLVGVESRGRYGSGCSGPGFRFLPGRSNLSSEATRERVAGLDSSACKGGSSQRCPARAGPKHRQTLRLAGPRRQTESLAAIALPHARGPGGAGGRSPPDSMK